MEAILREGALRLLASETSCDVVLSCQGQKLTAHKIMLSIASPILHDLLIEEKAELAVIIIPDVAGKIMSHLLDYIYNGSVLVPSLNVDDFLTAANLLKIHVDLDYSSPKITYEKPYEYNGNIKPKEDFLKPHDPKSEFFQGAYLHPPHHHHPHHPVDCDQKISDLSTSTMDVPTKRKTLRKVPNLMPISRFTGNVRLHKGNYNRPVPSPWCPRVIPLVTDPREDCLNAAASGSTSSPSPEYQEKNDNNNNFQFSDPLVNSPYYVRRPIRNNSPKNMCLKPLYKSVEVGNLTTYNNNNNNNKSIGGGGSCGGGGGLFAKKKLSLEGVHLSSSYKHKRVLEKTKILPSATTQQTIEPVEVPCTTPCSSGEEITEDGIATTSSHEDAALDDECRDGDNKCDKLKPYKCEDCGKSFSQLRNFKYHRSVHEGTREFAARCPECGKLFQDRGYLSSHMKIHRDRKEYACPSCPKRFNQRVAYNMHLRIHTGVKPHECTTCGKSFSRKMLLKQHQRVHTGERPYKCPQCGKSFADRSNMSLHARLHTGVKPYACTLCPKSFTKKHHLKTHMNYHTGLKPYSCEHCGLAFSQSSNMRTHYKKCVLKPPPPTT